jgi:two-component system nitrogen regulation response regulator GlnG
VRSFASPRDVLKALDDDEPQVLVSDIRMPGGSGIDLLAKVKARHPGLPVIIMTAFPTWTAPSAPSRAAPSSTCPSPST